MKRSFTLIPVCAALLAALIHSASVQADDLLKQAQKDLVALGYEPDNVEGEATTATAIAIARFQADNGLEVTGEATPILVGILAAKVSEQDAPPTAAAPRERDPEELRAAQQACLEKRAESARVAQQRKRGIGSLLNATGRVATRTGHQEITRATQDAYLAGVTADDLSSAARDLGLTADDVEACRNPR